MTFGSRIPAIAKDRRFVALWSAHSISTLGDALATLALILLITARTHSVAAVGVLTIVIAVPSIVLGLFAGAWVDRHDRRKIMIAADVFRALLLSALAIVMLLRPPVPVIYLFAFFQASVGTFFEPARGALMQVIVPPEDQVRANSLIQTTTVIAELAGATLAGFVVATLHAYPVAFLIDAATFASSAVLIATIRNVLPPAEDQRQSTRAAIIEGLQAVRTSRILRTLLLVFGMLSFALSPMAVLLTPYIVNTLHISPAWIGPIQAGDTAGNIIGGVFAVVAARHLKPRHLLVAGTMALAVGIAAFAWAATVLALMAVSLVFGLLTVAVQTGVGALTQTEVDNALMGRFVALMSIVPGAVSVLAMAFVGTLGAVIGIQTVFVMSGSILALSAGVAWHQLHQEATS